MTNQNTNIQLAQEEKDEAVKRWRKSQLRKIAINQQETRLLEAEERFLLDRAVRRKYGETIGDAESETARLHEIAIKVHRFADSTQFDESDIEKDEKSGSSAIHS